MVQLVQHTFCSFCGKKYESDAWPRECASCGNITYRNPIPAAILITPAIGGGIAVIRRGIEPGIGGLALTGGYREWGETWEQTAADEFEQETRIVGVVTPDKIVHFDTRTAHGGTRDMICGLFQGEVDPSQFIANEEATEMVVVHSGDDLVFDNNVVVVNRYLDELERLRNSS